MRRVTRSSLRPTVQAAALSTGLGNWWSWLVDKPTVIAEASILRLDGVLDAALNGTVATDELASTFPSLYLATFAFGVLVRLATLPFSCAGDRAVARVARAMPMLQKAFLSYAEVAWHPSARPDEIRLVKAKLTERRNVILKNYSTSNAAIILPAVVSGSAYTLFGAGAATESAKLVALARQSQEADAWFWGLGSLGGGLDPALLLAAVISSANLRLATNRRLGFSDHHDRAWDLVRTVCTTLPPVASFLAYGVILSTSSIDPNSWAMVIRGFAPFALGAALTGTLQTAIERNSTLKEMMNWPLRYPASHGSYGEYAWSPGAHNQRLKEASEDQGVSSYNRERYHYIKAELEYDLDLQLSKSIWRPLFEDTRYHHAPKMPDRMPDGTTWHKIGGKKTDEAPPPR